MSDVHFNLGAATPSGDNTKELAAMQGATAITVKMLGMDKCAFCNNNVFEQEKLNKFIVAVRKALSE